MRGIILDITDRKQAEEALNEKNEELTAVHTELRELNQNLEQKVMERTAEVEKLLKQKEEFISHLGHDLRSPLTPLCALLPIIQERETNPEFMEYLDVIAENVDYMKDLINETLELAQLNMDDSKLRISDINLDEALNESIDSEKGLFLESNIVVENLIKDEFVLSADRSKLIDVLKNLISNAVKFMPDGGVLSFNAWQKGEIVTISVGDTGIGLEDDQLSRIFDDFYKADESRHHLGSAGLGLSICRRIVEKHNGRIWAESEGVGKGTTLYFTIPAAVSSNTEESETASEELDDSESTPAKASATGDS